MIKLLSWASAAASRRGRCVPAVFLAALACCLSGVPRLAAQTRPLVIHGATILTGDGTTIERGTVILQDGKITAVGRKLDSPLLARKLEARGKYVTPGLIDVHSTLTLGSATGGGQALARAADAFDRYAVDDLRAALQQGVTAVYLPARTVAGIGGLGAVVRLDPRAALADLVLDDEAALCAGVGTDGGLGPVARVQAAEELRRRLQAAKDYREALEDYEESLKEYEEKLAERAKKEAEEAKKAEKDKNDKKPGKPGAANDKPKPAKEKKAKKEKKKDELKKPAEPAKDRNAEVLLRVLDGELRLRVEAHEPADILNVLEVAEEFNTALILEGATGAYLVAERLAELDVPVILSGPPGILAYEPGVRQYDCVEAADVLRRAGVEVYFGSGVVPSEATPYLALRVARAVGHGINADDALLAITSGAARLLGVEKEIGLLKAGLRADLVIWSDHPFAPGAQVERAYVGGREVYRAGPEVDDE